MSRSMADRIQLNISGTKFEVAKSTLLVHPNTRLAEAVKSNGGEKSELYFDRPLAPFEAILSYYQTGSLHLPLTVCPNVFRDELEFWGIDKNNMDQCCLLQYVRFMNECKLKSEFEAEKGNLGYCSKTHTGLLTTRQRIWSVIDYKERTWIAKCFLVLGLAMVLFSAMTLAISSLPQYRRQLSACEWREYIEDGGIDDPDAFQYFSQKDCNDIKLNTDNFYFYYYYYYDEYDDTTPAFSNISTITKNPNVTQFQAQFPKITLKNDIFYKIDYLATAFFTLEFLVRISVCPNILLYFKSILNVIDVLVLLGTYLDIMLSYVSSTFKFSSVLIGFVDFIKLLRIIRLVRYCQHLAAVQVLRFSFRQNFKDLMVLFFHIVIILLIFANLIYLAEDNSNIDSIPQGWWLGIITLTTVGYGDLSPKTVAGKITCSVCAIFGILMLSLIMPIFVDTFVNLYAIAQMDTTEGNQPTADDKCDIKSSENTRQISTIKVHPRDNQLEQT